VENSAGTYEEAFDSFVTPASDANVPLLGEVELPGRGEPLPEAMTEAISKCLTENEKCLGLLREAGRTKHCRHTWIYAIGNMPRLLDLKECAQLLKLAAVFHAHRGEAGAASAFIRDGLRLADSLDGDTDNTGACDQLSGSTLLDDLTYYALAVLDRTQASNNIRSELNRLDREIAFTMTNAESRNDPLQKVADLQDAIVMQSERDSLQKTLKIIDLKGTGKPSGWSLAELAEQQQQALQSLNMRAVVLEDSVGDLDKLLQGAMANAGFAQSSSEAGYTISASMVTQDTMQKEGWFWLRGTLVLRLAGPDGTVLGNKSWPVKVSATQENQLYGRMLAEIDHKLKNELKNTVLGFATGGQ